MLRIKQIKKNNYQSGFSLIEIIAVIFIIVIGLIGILSLVVQNIQIKNFNQNTLIASQLAQEGLELIRNTRDKNWLELNPFGSNLVSAGNSDTITIYFDGTDINISSVSDINSESAELKKNNNFYIHGTGEETIFKRVIELDNSGLDFITASSIVQWNSRNKIYNYEADTILYDWR